MTADTTWFYAHCKHCGETLKATTHQTLDKYVEEHVTSEHSEELQKVTEDVVHRFDLIGRQLLFRFQDEAGKPTQQMILGEISDASVKKVGTDGENEAYEMSVNLLPVRGGDYEPYVYREEEPDDSELNQ